MTSLRARLESLRAAELEGLAGDELAIADRVTKSWNFFRDMYFTIC